MASYRRKLKKGFRWWYKFDFDGTTYNSKAKYLTKKDCQKAERALLNELEKQVGQNDIRLLELFTHRLDYLELSRNQEYFKDNKRLCKKIIRSWGNIFVKEITPKMVSDLFLDEIRRCKALGLGNARPNQLLKVLRASLNYAINNFGVEFKDPTRGIQKLPEDISVKFIPTEEMIEEVIEQCNSDQRLLIKFVYEVGSRINEAIALDYEDVYEDYVVLYTRKSQNSQRTPRYLPRPDFIKKNGKGKVFKTWDAYPRFLEKKVRLLKQKSWNWHGLRRRRASIWASEDKPLFEIMMLLGHSQISTTQRYLFSLGIVKL